LIDEVVVKLVEGFTLIGDAFVLILLGIFHSFGLRLPDWAARLTLLGCSALVLWRLSRLMPKLILAGVIVVAASILLGFL
jgi:hypothetical protein